jgi:chromosome segregation ATPase
MIEQAIDGLRERIEELEEEIRSLRSDRYDAESRVATLSARLDAMWHKIVTMDWEAERRLTEHINQDHSAHTAGS